MCVGKGWDPALGTRKGWLRQDQRCEHTAKQIWLYQGTQLPCDSQCPANSTLRSPFWACKGRVSTEARRNTNCRAHTSLKHSLRANAMQFTSCLCGAAGSLRAQRERQQLQLGRRIWDLDVCTRPCLCPWKANLVLLFCYIHRCLEHSLEAQAFVFNSLSGHLQSFCFTQHCLAPLLCPSSVLITAPSTNVT